MGTTSKLVDRLLKSPPPPSPVSDVQYVKAWAILDHLNTQLKQDNPLIPRVPFGPQLSGCSPIVLANSVVLHRLTKAYEIPQSGDRLKRKERSIRAVLDRDEIGFNFEMDPTHPHWVAFLKARHTINALCSTLQPTYSLVFPTGEGFTSLSGEKDLYNKLERCNEVWECSPSSFRYVTVIFYRNLNMKRIVKRKFYSRVLEEFGWSRRDASTRLFNRHGTNGFAAFRTMMSLLVKITDIARLTTVPKDNSKDRVITCEPFLTMICQLSFMRDMRNALTRETGIDLSVLQDWHRARLRSGAATIDLRNASNQVWLDVVKQLFPARIRKILLGLRTGTLQDGDTYVHMNMFSPMGCGLTFDVMTWVLLALARVYDPTATVFGDDIMCTQGTAKKIIDLLPSFGLEVNTDKSFIEGNFRESCGAYGDIGSNTFITCYDLERPTSIPELISTINKLRRIIVANQCSGVLVSKLARAWSDLVDCFPRDALLGSDLTTILDTCILVPRTYIDAPVLFNPGWQRATNYCYEFLTYRKPRGGLVSQTMDTVRLLSMRDVRIYTADEPRLRRKLRFE